MDLEPGASVRSYQKFDLRNQRAQTVLAHGCQGFDPLDLPSAPSRALLLEIQRLARYDAVNVCIVGPSGTGKSLYAEELHRRSPRASGPFVKINLAAISAGLAASELLGHSAGAFTGAKSSRLGGVLSADGGTLVLDEVTKSSPEVQNLLLYVLDREPVRQPGNDRPISVDTRVVALTSTSLEESLNSGSLIPDLYERLKPFVVRIRPIAERLEDVEAVLRYAVVRRAPAFHYVLPPTIAPELVTALTQGGLSGNHREIDGIVQRLLVNADGAPQLGPEHLPQALEQDVVDRRSARERFLADQRGVAERRFKTVSDEADHYGVSTATIHRWRAELRTGPTLVEARSDSRETLVRAD